MRTRFMYWVPAAMGMLAFSSLALAQSAQQAGAAKAQAATRPPDLSGVWEVAPRSANAGVARTDSMPLTPWAAEVYEYNRDPRKGGENRGKIELDPRSHCFPPSTQFLMSYTDPFE